MILTDSEILKAIENKEIVILPYDPTCLGTNSYDVHLSKYLATYKEGIVFW
jgi:dCTP deaminase